MLRGMIDEHEAASRALMERSIAGLAVADKSTAPVPGAKQEVVAVKRRI